MDVDKSFFEIYAKANKLIQQDKVSLENIVEDTSFVKYVFEVDEETVMIKYTHEGSGGPWKRSVSCSCKACSIFGFDNRISCSRRKATEKYLLDRAKNL